MASSSMPLFTVMDMSAIVARINLSQEQAKDIPVGAESILTPVDGSEPVTGKVTIVSPAVDANSTTVQVWVQAANPNERLRAGASVRVTIVVATVNDATTIPASAVLPNEEGGTMVITVDDKDIAHHRTVKIGVREAEVVQVLDGLKPEERVVTVGGLGLEDMAKVRVPESGGGAADDGKRGTDKPASESAK
jgi:RND family efflux transporter MFP subunit